MALNLIEQPLDNAAILIAGYGREGQSTHRFLNEHCPGATVVVAHDDREMADLLGQRRGRCEGSGEDLLRERQWAVRDVRE